MSIKMCWYGIIAVVSLVLYVIGGGGLINLVTVSLMAGTLSQCGKNWKWWWIMFGFQWVWLIVVMVIRYIGG